MTRYTFYIDPETEQPHLWSHRVTEQETIEVIENPDAEDFASDRGSRKALGQTLAGRFLQVIYRVDEDEQGELVFVVTAFPLSSKRLKALRRRGR